MGDCRALGDEAGGGARLDLALEEIDAAGVAQDRLWLDACP
jgi:hypothetical protein